MKTIEQLKTWEDLQEYLLERLDYATSDPSKSNKSFTKEDHWNSLMGQTMNYSGDLPARTFDILIKRVKKDFP